MPKQPEHLRTIGVTYRVILYLANCHSEQPEIVRPPNTETMPTVSFNSCTMCLWQNGLFHATSLRMHFSAWLYV